MPTSKRRTTLETLRHHAIGMIPEAPDYQPLLDQIGESRVVLLGESSHGTHEFYQVRAEITRHLIMEKGFTAIAVEGDWPDAYQINRFIRHEADIETATQALGGFKRFPAWMWRNTEILEFMGWLRQHNGNVISEDRQVGFYGLDLYSLYTSMEAVIQYLERIDPEAAQQARKRYACFDHFDEDSQAYGYSTHFGLMPSCEDEVIGVLLDLQRNSISYLERPDGRLVRDDYFYAEQNAIVAIDAEEYYRSMFQGNVLSWNLRDRHMVGTLIRLMNFLREQHGRDPKVVVWAHNSHVGDARATDMGRRGELNIGQLVREHFRHEAFSTGFSTYTGTVTAATDWDAPMQRRHVRPGLPGSYEGLFHEARIPRFYLNLHQDETYDALKEPRLERAIGVIYRPETERMSHYFGARLSDQFDAMLYFDITRALEPLDKTSLWEVGEIPETYPFAV